MIWALIGLALGGILKGATGAGAPIVAIPALTMAVDVKFAVTMMLMPNLFSNLWQGWTYRKHSLPRRFLLLFCLSGAVGIGLGSLMLAYVSPDTLSLLVAAGVAIYVVLRLLKSGWYLAYPLAERLAAPAGLLGGLLQGATGLSAPASLTFLNAMRLDRPVFIGTISAFFVTITATQVPTLYALGFLTPMLLAQSLGALAILSLFMPVGRKLAQIWSRETFDRVILVLLAVIAIRIVWQAI